MILQILHHPKGSETLHPENREQLCIADGELLVLWVCQILFFDDGPHFLDHFVTSHLFLSHDGSQLRAQAFVQDTVRLCLSLTKKEKKARSNNNLGEPNPHFFREDSYTPQVRSRDSEISIALD
jgi:hypothetical protein